MHQSFDVTVFIHFRVFYNRVVKCRKAVLTAQFMHCIIIADVVHTAEVQPGLLTAYNSRTTTYDSIASPLQYRNGISFTLKNGRQPATFYNSVYNISYNYDYDYPGQLSLAYD